MTRARTSPGWGCALLLAAAGPAWSQALPQPWPHSHAPAAAAQPRPQEPAHSALATASPPRTAERERLGELERAQLHFTTALHAQTRGDHRTATAEYVLALQLDAGFVEALVNLAQLRIEQKREAVAEALLAQAASLRPDYPQIPLTRGWLAARRGDVARARAEFERAIALQPDSIEARVNLGGLLLKHGSPARATQLLEEALALDPQSADAAYNLALARERLGELSRAQAAYQRFLAIGEAADPLREPVQLRLESLARAAAAAQPLQRLAPAAPAESGESLR